MLGDAAVAVLNHLLAQSGWALQRLAPFGGKAVRINLFPFSFVCAIQEDGTLRNAAPGTPEDASCTVAPSLLPLLAAQDESALERVTHGGDERLVHEILFLARNLRWDVAEDLSRFTGDIAAERMVRLAGGVHGHVRDSALHFLETLKEYWTEERPLIAKPAHLRTFGSEVGGLQDALERLEARVRALSGNADRIA